MEVSNTHLYLTLSNYGKVIPLRDRIYNSDDLIDWTEKEFEYVRYNPRKDINRYGLSITSLDGGLSGRPDLDSLTEYNHELGNFTPDDSIKALCDEWQPYLFRTHIIRIAPGGYFPPHRDHTNTNIESLRLIMPLKNCEAPQLTFILDNDIINWQQGRLYFIDTAKMHYLFNPSFDPAYMLVMNVGVNLHSVQNIINKFESR